MFSMTVSVHPQLNAAAGALHVWELTAAKEGRLTATETAQPAMH